MLLLALCTFLGVTRYVVTDADPTAWATAAVAIGFAEAVFDGGEVPISLDDSIGNMMVLDAIHGGGAVG